MAVAITILRLNRALFLAAFLAPVATPAQASADAASDPDAVVAMCFDAWQEQQASHGGGDLTLFEHAVKKRSTYTIVELTLGSGEGRVFSGACRIKDGKLTHTY
ncbi:MAG: hypothetical protein V3U18_01490 [Alphaproteobacteria bacterium]